MSKFSPKLLPPAALARAAGWMVGAIALIVLVGWSLDVRILQSLVPGWPAMKPNTALAFLATATALLLSQRAAQLTTGPRPWLIWLSAGFVTMLGALTFIEHALSRDLGIDQLLFRAAYDPTAIAPGRMSPLAALAFFVLGIALALLTCGKRPLCAWLAQLGALASAFGAFVAAIGYLYGRVTLGQAPFFTSTALHTALALIVLSVGVACAHPASGLMGLFNANSAGGTIFRRLLIPITLLPIGINWFEREGELRGLYPVGFGWMLDAAVTVLLVGLVLWIVARRLHEKDLMRQATEDELQRSEERYRQLVEMSPYAIVVKDERRIEFANPAARALVGAEQAQEMLGKSPFAFVHPETRAKFEKNFCRVLRDGTPLPRMEQKVVRLDGREIDVEISATAVHYHGQRLAQVVARDITEAKRAAQALHESEERFRLIAGTVSEVFWLEDVQPARVLYVSPAYEKIWGRPCASLLEQPRSHLDAIHPDDCARVLADLEQKKVGLPYEHEFRLLLPDGSIRWIWNRGYPVPPDGPEVRQYVNVAQDITQAKQTREELRESVERQRLIARVTGDAIWDWDLVNDLTWWSDAFVTKFGYAADTIPSFAAWIEHVHPEDRERATAEFNEAIVRKAASWTSEYRFRRADGTYGIILDRVYCMSDEPGKPVRMIGSMVDISEIRRVESQARLLAHAAESTNDLISITDLDNRFLFVNRAFLDAYGYSAEEVLGKTPAMLSPSGEDVATAIRPATLAGRWSGELTNRRKDGSEFPIQLSASPVRDAQGNVIALIGVARDITERRRAEAQLRFQAWLLDQVRNAVIATDAEGRITYWNRHAAALYQWTDTEAVGQMLEELIISPEERDRAAAIVKKMERTGSWEGEFTVRSKDGRTFPAYAVDTLLRDELNRIVGIVGVSFDISERKRAEENVRASEARFRATFEQAAMGMTITAPDGRFLRVNEKFCAITGYGAEELATLTFQAITYHEDLAHHLELNRRLLAGELTSGTIAKRCVRKGGVNVWVEITSSFVRETEAALGYFISLVEDITPRRQLEAQVLHAQKMEAVGQLAGGVAHDFNNMLTAIQGHTALMGMTGGLPPSARESLDEIARAAERATSLTRQLLLFSRREVMQPSRINVNDTITQIAKMLQRLIGEDIRMTLHLHPKPLWVVADSGMIDQVLMNLAVNARDAMTAGGELTIETSHSNIPISSVDMGEARPGRYVCITVSDTGTGIPPHVLPRIFEPFFTTKEAGKGTGLGLATVFGIANQHRGFVRVYSELGRGTTFRVYLPLGETTGTGSVPATPMAWPRGRGEWILLTEDDASVRNMTCVMLERHGYAVAVAVNAREALALWAESPAKFALLLTDMVMPGSMNGAELARQLRAQRPDLKVIFTSGYSEALAGKSLVFQSGQAFMQKPFDPSKLLVTLDRLLHGSSPLIE